MIKQVDNCILIEYKLQCQSFIFSMYIENYKEDCFALFVAEALLQSRPLPHIPALPEGDPPSGSSVQSISQQANVQQHTSVSATGLLEAANR